MSLTRYPEYKEVKISWIDEMPSHWRQKRLRFAACLNPSKAKVRRLDADALVSFLPMEAVGEDGSLRLEELRRLDEVIDGYTYFEERDVGIAKITPCFENGKAAIMEGLRNRIGFGTTELTILRAEPDISDPSFLYRLVTSEPFRRLGESAMYGAGGQKRVPDDFVRNFRFALPPIQEQQKIAEFLDYETARINELIENQKRLIELLKEERQAVISHAVTKGLDPDAPMKDSGVEWFGNVPAHWEVSALRRYLQTGLSNGIFKKKEEFGTGALLVNVQDAYTGDHYVDTDKLERVKCSKAELESFRAERGDIFLVRSSLKREGVASAVLLDTEVDDCVFECHLIKVRLEEDRLDPRFATLVLSSRLHNEYLVEASNTTTMTTISQSPILATPIPTPPIQEQLEIAESVDAEIGAIDRLVRESTKLSVLLRERRSALISAAVTGKIDVRNWQAPAESETETCSMAAVPEASYEVSPS